MTDETDIKRTTHDGTLTETEASIVRESLAGRDGLSNVRVSISTSGRYVAADYDLDGLHGVLVVSDLSDEKRDEFPVA